MALTIKTNRMLWGRAASRCSLSECRRELVIDAADTDDPSLVGEAAHIVAEQADGPRGDPLLSLAKRNAYSNLILLCNIHHKQVDDQLSQFTVDRLLKIKVDHESWVRTALSTYDPLKQANDERWAGYIEEWALRAKLATWLDETYGLLQPNPIVSKEFVDSLSALQYWIMSRIWPTTGASLREALISFRLVVSDLITVFMKHSEVFGDKHLSTKRFYQSSDWDEDLYAKLLGKYEYHIDLVADLTCEMTRAANHVCDVVRQHLDSSFRVAEGVLLVRRGVDMSLKETTLRIEYGVEERSMQPYPGLLKFMDIRQQRDYFVGAGTSTDYTPVWHQLGDR